MATRRTKTVLLLSGLLLAWVAIVLLNGGPPFFYFDPLAARVVDADTKQPVEGAIVTANWELVTGSLDGKRVKGQLNVMEAVTDRDGRFKFPGFTRPNLWGYEIRTGDPQLLIFKPGYLFVAWDNPNYMMAFNWNPHRSSPANGRTFELQRFAGTSKEYAYKLDFLGSALHFATWGDDCEWKAIPEMIISLDRLKNEYEKLGIGLGVPSIQELPERFSCRSAVKYFAEYRKP